MDKDKSPAIGGGGLPPHSSRYSALGMKCESSEPGQFSHDISQMPDFPPRSTGHRRAQSEILGLPDDISFDSDLGVVGSGDGPSLSDETDEYLQFMYLDMDKFMSSSVTPGLDLSGAEASEMGGAPDQLVSLGEGSGSGSSERPRIRHQHSQSMDGSSSIKPEMLGAGGEEASLVDAKKAMSAAKLADLALIDPKRAKRIWANRQSAARSKERKMRYIAELERKMQTMQTEATTLSAQLGLLQRDTTGLTAENSELKLRVQGMEQQVHLQDALNDALREEVQRLKVATGQTNFPNGAPMMNYGASSFGGNQNLYHHNHAMQSLLAAQQLQQLQLHSQHQQQLHQHHHQYQQQPPSDRKLRNAMTSQTQRESTSDNINTPKE